MAGIRTCDRESQVQRPNHYTTEPPSILTIVSPMLYYRDSNTAMIGLAKVASDVEQCMGVCGAEGAMLPEICRFLG